MIYLLQDIEHWEPVLELVPQSLRLKWEILDAELFGRRQRTRNHPLVNSGSAYWSDSSTLCTGYQLVNNPEVFRPIFQTSRQIKIDGFLGNICRVAEKRRETLAYVSLFKIKKLPTVLVEKIIKFAY